MVWTALGWLFTFFVPGFMLEWIGCKHSEQKSAWRQKIALFVIFVILSGLLIGILEFGASGKFGLALTVPCGNSAQKLMSVADVQAAENQFYANGKIVDTALLDDTYSGLKQFGAGNLDDKDLSEVFPTYILLGRPDRTAPYPDSDINNCVKGRVAKADQWLTSRLKAPGISVSGNNKLSGCPYPSGKSSTCYFSKADKDKFIAATVGDIAYSKADVANRTNVGNGNALIIIKNSVYNVGKYLQFATSGSSAVGSPSSFFADEVVEVLEKNLGGDATNAFASLTDGDATIKCMDKLFYVGALANGKSTTSSSCPDKISLPMVGVYVIVGILLLLKAIIACFSRKALSIIPPTESIIMMVPCLDESKEEFEACFESLANSDYPDKQKLLVVVCDGQIRNAQNNFTEQSVIQALKCTSQSTKAINYTSLGRGFNVHNDVQLRSGVFQTKSMRRIPYIVITKIGNEQEESLFQAGTRGQLDSEMILLNWLHRGPTSSATLLDKHLSALVQALGVNIRQFKFLMTVKPNSVIDESTPMAFIKRMERDPDVDALGGRMEYGFGAALFDYPTYLSRDAGMKFAENFGVQANLPGTIKMIRLETVSGQECATHPDFVAAYTNNYNPANTMHEKNCLKLISDRNILPALGKAFGRAKVGYCEEAVVYTNLPGLQKAFTQKIHDYRSTFHSRWNLVGAKGIGSWTQMWSFFECLGMMLLPALAIYSYLLLVRFVMDFENYFNAAAVGVILLFFILQFVTLLLKGRINLLGSLCLYLIIGIPIFCIILPILAFWTMDYFNDAKDFQVADDLPDRNSVFEEAPKPQPQLSPPQQMRKNVPLPPKPVAPESRPQTFMTEGTLHPGANMTMRTEKNPGTNGIQPYDSATAILENYNDRSSIYTTDSRPVNTQTLYQPSSPTVVAPPPPIANMKRPVSPPVPRQQLSPQKAQSPPPQQTQSLQYRPTKFNDEEEAPNRPSQQERAQKAISMAQSDYLSEYAEDVMSIRSSQYDNRASVAASIYTLGNNRPYSTESDHVVKDEIRAEIMFMLSDADLNTVTRREVREHLYVQFGETVDEYHDYINLCIEEYTLEKLALV